MTIADLDPDAVRAMAASEWPKAHRRALDSLTFHQRALVLAKGSVHHAEAGIAAAAAIIALTEKASA